uniref:Uncharacterized protein n=1 Tax=Rhizophora mucronata TaxID=61149 RepID=A0A2P2QB89_RHIMU
MDLFCFASLMTIHLKLKHYVANLEFFRVGEHLSTSSKK